MSSCPHTISQGKKRPWVSTFTLIFTAPGGMALFLSFFLHAAKKSALGKEMKIVCYS
jgi:hypothetical protein